MAKIPPIYFYLPAADYLTDLPDDADHYWGGFRKGLYCWTLQTYLHLKNHGFPCQLVTTIPDMGIIVAHWDSLPRSLTPSPNQLIVCIQADRARHPYAQVHIVQNRDGIRRDLMTWGDRYLLPGQDYYMPHWPQPGLIPRSTERRDTFENLGFFGLDCNLPAELKTTDWQEQLHSIGMNWLIVKESEQWNDYSQIDGVVAVRSFQQTGFTWKPPTKLFNAWHAGVPAILGSESAYQAERKSVYDYLEVSSLKQTREGIIRLKEDIKLRRAMVDNGHRRAHETSKEKLVQRWIFLLEEELSPQFYTWTQFKQYRASFVKRRRLAISSKEKRKFLQGTRNKLSIKNQVKRLF